ncbi:GMC family oxidoreductase N-terminal domain-containing protein [Rhizobium sp. BK251]|uniref:GMC family oxidoreductase n=1 Tax=Rhizobium sp. BK251 TaxID=2512125 RepID=UPI0010446650|nr:GMC family oxidoreductase N-terminal domain-containing protein [Rhizobium sp. BK251]TCL71258.1 choline dehydrogenase-like flavoprotein [Rhizobium sp. BK251]
MPDYIIVGGGSAGCVLAARLSEDQDVTVALIEAGPPDRNMFIHMPAGFSRMTAGPLIWGYETAPGREIGGRRMVYPQARVLGGGSSINAQVFTRGCPADYDGWEAEEGCTGWSYADVLPYFRRSEGNDTFGGEHHGTEGPLGVSFQTPHPLTRAFVRAAQEAGLPYNADFNAGRQEGCGYYQTTTREGRRSSAAVGYLRPALGRANLKVTTGVLVKRIVVKGGRAIGVEIVENGRTTLVHADREVIVTAGAIGSPKLLMLSGIGPAAHLKETGIEVAHDAPEVGRNLQDHMDVDVLAELSGPHGIDRYKKRRWQLAAGLEYLLFGKGPAASNLVEAGGFWWGDRAEKTPDIQFHFLPGAGVEEGIGTVPGGNGCTLNSYHVRPRSRGSVTLKSADPRDAPVIDPNAFSEPYDLDRAVDGIMISREILAQPAFRSLIRSEYLPGDRVKNRADALDFARQYGRSAYHPVGTCRMGGSAQAVVDPQLRLNGIEALRVCDSSVMPRLISSNTNAATIMIAEKAADLIREAGKTTPPS